MAIIAALLVVAFSAGASAGFLDQALKVALWSAIATDRQQTAQWIDYTPSEPMTLTWEFQPGGSASRYSFRCDCIYEGNRILAGQREKMDPYFDWWANAVEAAPVSEWSPVAKVGAALFAANWVRVAVNNNRSPEAINDNFSEAGMRYTGPSLSRFAVLEYRTRF